MYRAVADSHTETDRRENTVVLWLILTYFIQYNGPQYSQVSLACLAVLDKAVFYRHIYLHSILMVL